MVADKSVMVDSPLSLNADFVWTHGKPHPPVYFPNPQNVSEGFGLDDSGGYRNSSREVLL